MKLFEFIMPPNKCKLNFNFEELGRGYDKTIIGWFAKTESSLED